MEKVMIKIVIMLFVLIVLILPAIFAAQIEMNSEFKQGETLIAKISGTFLETIYKENILMYRGHVRVPLDVEIAKIIEDYYIYAQLLGKSENDYSLRIEGLQYITAGRVSEEDIIKNFSITNQTADFLVDPGFVVTENDFSIEIQNLQNQDISVLVQTSAQASQSQQEQADKSNQTFFDIIFGTRDEEQPKEQIGLIVELKPGQRKSINFGVEGITEPTFDAMTLSSTNSVYEVPVYITPTKKAVQESEKSMLFSPATLDISMATSSEATRIIYLYNDGKALLENISLSVSESLKPYLSLSAEQIDELGENESIKITLNIISGEDEGVAEGELTASLDSLKTSMAISLNFIPGYQPPPGENISVPDPAVLKTCEEMNGTICQENQQCDAESEFARDGNCCLGSCIEVKKDSRGKIIGWVIIIFIILLALWFFKAKFKKAKRSPDLLKAASGRKK